MGDTSEINPYAAPETPNAAFLTPAQASDAEQIRRKYLKHEMNIKSCGALYLLGAVLTLPMVVLMIVGIVSGNSGVGPAEVFIGLMFAGLACLGGVVGWGLRKLQPWVKVPAAIMAALSLLNVPIGTILGIAVFYFVFSEKGTYCFSPEYQEIIRQTPHVKLKTSWIAWVALGFIVILLIMALMGFAVQR